VDAFVRWHAARHQVRITTFARGAAQSLRTIARALQLPQAEALARYCRTLPDPEPMHDKQYQMPSLAELDSVGNQLMRLAQQPYSVRRDTPYPGLQHALRYQRGLILKLLVRVPLRSQNIRGLRQPTNLYQDAHGRWYLHFRGGELKIERRKGRLNNFHNPWPEDILRELEIFLQTYRPQIPHADHSSHLFLTRYGNAYGRDELRLVLHYSVLQCIGKPFYPHWVRTIYATEMRDHGTPVETVAYMLNDTPETVHRAYYETRVNEHYPKAQAATQQLLKQTQLILSPTE